VKPWLMTDDEFKELDLGKRAKILIDLHLENPEKFSKEFILDQLFKQYEKQGFKS
jgi:hypothetical protein